MILVSGAAWEISSNLIIPDAFSSGGMKTQAQLWKNVHFSAWALLFWDLTV